MLKEIRCSQLIQKKLEFNSGLNVLTGSDDGANSIGKSSVLMLLDFAFAGDDFLKLCSDVIDNVGIITVEMDFTFGDVRHSFSRSTNDPKVVTFLSEKDTPEKSLDEYRSFLKEVYCFPEYGASFRGAVNPFFRIWGKDNYNPNKPLNSFPSEPYSSIKPNLLKLYSLYGSLRELEKEKSATEKKKSVLKGAFNEGYIKSITKSQKDKCESRLNVLAIEITKIKDSLENYSISANQIINEENMKIKSEKDELVTSLFHLKKRLKRTNDNLTYGNTANKKNFEKLKDYFPEVDIDKLAKIDQFHSGIKKILKAELREEKSLLEEQIESLEIKIKSAETKLLESARAVGRPSGLVDKMLALSLEEKDIRDQIRFREIKSTIDDKVEEISGKIVDSYAKSLSTIESKLNTSMSKYIKKFYKGNPVSPKIKLSETRYEFDHDDDSGTGKAYANMLSLDMSFLEDTYLPALIHDLVVFSNIEDHAIEGIFEEYSSTKKQVFISIDKINRFKSEIQKLIKDNEFLALGPNRLAFGKSWNNRT
ncbi:hypothetical protein ATY36_03470 [Vibrio cidicii]|uniref:DUF2326 domain-containing protein n=1 Tax=Vibrio cidicii TaxID=1763883 RepID=UPI0007801051|nr:DUF2326 domain-containing protein [Vibrio cidicii]KYN87436.1 hypothetical protein ATY36_03470 [Vibrio cidicii]